MRQNKTMLKGSNVERPWDYVHINGVDKDSDGDYYISCKTTQSIYKIAGAESSLGYPGSVIWKLAGWKHGANVNDFKMQDGFNFSGQHHPRIISVSKETTILSLFDNAITEKGTTPTSSASSGKIVELNNVTMTARLLEQYFPPNGIRNPIQGTTQRLPSGNVYMAWGPNNMLSEHEKGLPGKQIWSAIFGSGLDLENYRSYKSPWKGYPLESPRIFVYAQSCSAPTYVYMSWNGATEHRNWAVFTATSKTDQGRAVVTTKREGYETKAAIPSGPVPLYVYVQALDDSGEVLGTSEHVKVWVPDDMTRFLANCGTDRCEPGLKTYDEAQNKVDQCK